MVAADCPIKPPITGTTLRVGFRATRINSSTRARKRPLLRASVISTDAAKRCVEAERELARQLRKPTDMVLGRDLRLPVQTAKVAKPAPHGSVRRIVRRTAAASDSWPLTPTPLPGVSGRGSYRSAVAAAFIFSLQLLCTVPFDAPHEALLRRRCSARQSPHVLVSASASAIH